MSCREKLDGHRVAKKQGHGSPVDENGDAIGDLCGNQNVDSMLPYALRVTCKYKKPVYWRERLSNDKYCPSVEKYNFRSEHPGDFRAVLFQLTTTGVLAREQARRKSRRFNEYDNYGPDGPEFPGF